MQLIRVFAALAWLLGSLTWGPDAIAKSIVEREPSPKQAGTQFKWTSPTGIAYHYRLPKNYDKKKGANLTFILHGSNLDHRWGFANHASKSFRPDDIVVSPDGTSQRTPIQFNSFGRPADAKKFNKFHKEIMSLLNVRATYIYGHSQGSFFALYYAGEYPADVQGVVAHASGVWTQTKLGKKGHHQAIVLMHGTQDPAVPYVQSVGGYESYAERKYPLLRLRSLEWWNHWPAEHNGPVPHTSQQLAWVEGMTTDDIDRLAVCWNDVLGEVKNAERHDYAGAYQLAMRISETEDAPAKLKKDAAAAIKTIDNLIKEHLEAMKLGEKDSLTLDDSEQAAHYIYFARRFMGIPACDTILDTHVKTFKKHKKVAVTHLKKYFAAKRGGKEKDAFGHGVDAVVKGFLWTEIHDKTFRNKMKELRTKAKKLKCPKGLIAKYDEAVAPLFDAMDKSWKAFSKVNSKNGKW